MYVCMYVYMYTYMCVYIYTHIHTCMYKIGVTESQKAFMASKILCVCACI